MNAIALISVGSGGVANLVLEEPVRCACGRAALIVVNRDGKTRCIACDSDYQRHEAEAAADQVLAQEFQGKEVQA